MPPIDERSHRLRLFAGNDVAEFIAFLIGCGARPSPSDHVSQRHANGHIDDGTLAA